MKFRKVGSCLVPALVAFLVLFSFLPAQSIRAAGTILYVSQEASDGNHCSSWQDSCDLQTALTSAVAGDEIWVAAGVYFPTGGTDRTVTFQLKSGVAVYGGFAGTETSRDQRSWLENYTLLEGDIGGTQKTDNSYHVVTGANGATLDGFLIENGYANGTYPNDHGGGMYNNNCSPTLSNLGFDFNTASAGGGMYNNNSHPTLTGIYFIENSAGDGAGMQNDNGSHPTLENVTFDNNTATSGAGGGMRNRASSPVLNNDTFYQNFAKLKGAGMADEQSSNPILTNVTFDNNTTEGKGGGMSNDQSSPTLTDVLFTDNNHADDVGGGMYNSHSSPVLARVTFDGNVGIAAAGGIQDDNGSSPGLTDVYFYGNMTLGSGGGMRNVDSSPSLTNVTFDENYSEGNGGGIDNEGSSSPTLTNVTFWKNQAVNGGGMSASYPSFPTLANVTLHLNTASQAGAALYIDGYSDGGNNIVIRNSILWDNSAPTGKQVDYANGSNKYQISTSVVQGMTGYPDIITTDPKLGTLGPNGGFTPTIPLLVGSSAIDTGDDATCPATDQRGVHRPQGSHCDIGAYEYFDDTTPPVVDSFDVPTSGNSLDIPILAFTASDNLVVTGYMITTTSTPPDRGDAGWTDITPMFFHVSADGTYDLYPWVKDPAGNVSAVYPTPRAVTVDTTPPQVISITRLDENPTEQVSVRFTVTFSEPVTIEAVSDFALIKTGSITGEAVTDVSGGPMVYTVTVDTGQGSGTLQLDILCGAQIYDGFMNYIQCPYTEGEVYTISKTYNIFLPLIVR